MFANKKDAIVTTEKITKDYLSGDEICTVLHGVDMQLFPGELVMLVGPSGCGKTTLLSIITGVLTPTSGKVFIHDTDLTTLSDQEKVLFRRREIGFIFQHYHLFSALTAAENATIPLVAAGLPMKTVLHKAEDILKQMDMGDCLDKLPGHLSGGQQQRVAIARALIHEPELIVCDEPTSALDHNTGEAVMEILKTKVLNSGRTVLVVTHDSRIYHFADRMIYMDDGYIVKEEKKSSMI